MVARAKTSARRVRGRGRVVDVERLKCIFVRFELFRVEVEEREREWATVLAVRLIQVVCVKGDLRWCVELKESV